MRLISEGQMEKARELSRQIYLYSLNSIEKEKKETLTAGALPESAFENLRITYNRNSAVIVWDTMPKEVTAFRIYRSKGSHATALDDTEIFVEEIPASRFTNRFVHQFDKPGARYSYQIEALNKKGWSLVKSQKLHANQVFIYEGRQKIVDFRNFSDTGFTHVRIKSNEYIDGKETSIPQRLILKPDAALEGGARVSVNFLECEKKADGSKVCKKLDSQFVEVYVLNRSHPIKKTTAFLQNQISRLSAAFIPEAHAETGDETTYYLLTDHLGSVDVVLDEDGNVVERRDYLPYGSERITDAQPDATETDHKFTGKELDDETGLYYYGARYYDSEIGRFVSVDPWEGKMTAPQTLNKYAYTLNNPVKYVDPTGKESSPAQKFMRNMIQYLASKSEEFKEAVKSVTTVVVTRDVYEGTSVDNTQELYYKDNLSVRVGKIELNNLEVQSTIDGTTASENQDNLQDGYSYDAKIGADGATKTFIDDTLQIDGAYFLHEANPEGKPYSQGCTVTKTEDDNREVMDILRQDLGFEDGETVKYSFDATPQPTQPEDKDKTEN